MHALQVRCVKCLWVKFSVNIASGGFRVNEEGGPKIEFLTKAKWEQSSHVVGAQAQWVFSQ